jgi:hypothetical protein
MHQNLDAVLRASTRLRPVPTTYEDFTAASCRYWTTSALRVRVFRQHTEAKICSDLAILASCNLQWILTVAVRGKCARGSDRSASYLCLLS